MQYYSAEDLAEQERSARAWRRRKNRSGLPHSLEWYAIPETKLPPGFSLTRASAGRYYDSAGLLQTAATDVARGTYRYNGSAWVFDGTMIEQAATNICLRSNALSTAPWSNLLNVLSQTKTGPDGQANSAWLATDSNGGATAYVQQSTIATTVATYALSFFVEKTAGPQGGYPVIYMYNGGVRGAFVTVDTTNEIATVWTAYTGLTITTSSARILESGPTWLRVELTFLADGGDWQVWVTPAGTANATQSTGVLDPAVQGSAGFYGFQVELGSSATSYIATGAASATRNADVVTATTSGLLVNGQGFAAMKFRYIADTNASWNALLSTYTVGEGMPLAYWGGFLRLFDGSAWRDGPAFTPTSGATYSVASTWAGAASALALNGSTASAGFDSSMSLGSTMGVGQNPAASAFPVSMVLQSMRLGVVQVTAAQLQNLST